jgi:hypothetical protein
VLSQYLWLLPEALFDCTSVIHQAYPLHFMSSHSVLRRLLHDSYAKVKMLRVSDHEPVPTPLKYSYSFAVASPALNYTVVPSSEATLKVLQLNAAMLPFQRHAEERCHRLVSLIKDYDIILLQVRALFPFTLALQACVGIFNLCIGVIELI